MENYLVLTKVVGSAADIESVFSLLVQPQVTKGYQVKTVQFYSAGKDAGDAVCVVTLKKTLVACLVEKLQQLKPAYSNLVAEASEKFEEAKLKVQTLEDEAKGLAEKVKTEAKSLVDDLKEKAQTTKQF